MTSYSSNMYEEIEKYAADLEITCDYYIQEFQVQQRTLRQPSRRSSILNDFLDSSQTDHQTPQRGFFVVIIRR